MAARLDKTKLKKNLLELYKKNQDNNKVFRAKVKELMQSTLRDYGRSETTQELYNIYSSGDALNEFLDSYLYAPEAVKKPPAKEKKKSKPKSKAVVSHRSPRSRPSQSTARSSKSTVSRAVDDNTAAAAAAARTLFGSKKRRKKKKSKRKRKKSKGKK